MKKKITAVCLAALMCMALMAGCGSNSTTTETTEPEKVTPTFMYFVSGADEDFDAATAVFEELKAEYDGDVNFSLINIDEDTDTLANFPLVQDNTPMLIMLNTSNDISALSPKTSDKETLEATIEEALK